MSKTVKRPAIPATTGVKNWESLRRFLEPVKTLLEIHEGWRGRKGIDRFVPEWELGELANQVAGKDISEFIGNDTEAPDPPTGFTVTSGAWGNNILSWTNPGDDDLMAIEIYVNTINSLTSIVSNAHRAGLVTVANRQDQEEDFTHWPANIFSDHYYWIRAVDWSGNYSEWVGDVSGEGNGAIAPGIDTVGEVIDTVMDILKGGQPVYSAWDIATTYEAGNRVVYDGRTWECYNAVTGVAPTDATGSSYWFRVGILIEGDVDGIPTVGIDGNAVVDGSITAAAIATDQLQVGNNISIVDGAIQIAALGSDTVAQVANNKTENSVTTISRPGGGFFTSNSSAQSGALVVTLPQSWTNTMMKMEVDVYLYRDSASFKIMCGGYNYQAAVWIRTFAQLIGNKNSDNRVRFGHNGTNCCIVIGETTSSWDYPAVSIKNFQASYSNYSIDQWDDGWNVSLETDLSGYTFTSDFSDALIDAKSVKTLVGSDLEPATAGADKTETSNFVTVTYAADKTNLEGLIDGKIKVFQQTSIPTSISVGDLWVDTDDGNKLYRARIKWANEIKAGEWELVQDAGATYALLGLNSSGLITQWVRANLFPSTGASTPGSSGLWITNSHLGYYNHLTTSWPVYIKNDGSFWFGKDSNNYFAYTTIGSSLVFSSNQSGAFWMLEGSDINMQSTSSNPSMIKWYGTGYDIYMGRYPSGSALIFQPETEFYGGFVVGGVVSSGAQKYFYSTQISALEHSINTSNTAKTLTGQIFFRYDYLRIKTPYIRPDGTVNLGSSTYPFASVYLSGSISCGSISCGALTPTGEVANFSMGSQGIITGTTNMILDAGGVDYTFAATAMYPGGVTDETRNLGTASYSWNNVYAKTYYDNGGGYNDRWINPETGIAEDVDDLLVIKSMAADGEYDPVSGQLKIDHAKSHPILFARHGKDRVEWDDNGKVLASHKKGSVIRDREGRPFYDIGTRTGLAFGAIRQLDAKIEEIVKTLRDHHLMGDPVIL